MLTLNFGFDPIIAQIGPFQLGWHGLFTALAVAVGLWLAGRLASQRGIPSDLVSGVALWAVVGGVIGARLFHVLDHLPFYLQNPLLIPAVWEGGIAVYGAFIGGLLAGGIAALGYAAIRFVLTFLRQEPAIVLGLQEAQVIAVLTGLLALGMLAWRHFGLERRLRSVPAV